MSENSLSASETSNSQYLDDLANQNLNISQYLEGPTNPDLDIRQHLNDPTILSGCMVPVTIQSFTTDPDNITPTTITARLCGFGWGAVQFIAFYDSQESQTPSGYALVRGMESDWTDKQIADYATTQVLREMPNTDESLKSLMLDAIEDFRQRSDQTRADNDALLGLLPFEQISPKYAETRDELLSQNGQEPTSAEIFEALVAKYSQNSNETEIVNTPAIEDANNNANSPEVTPATPRIRVTITNNYDRDPDSPFYDAYVMLKNSGALILPMDGKVTVWPSDVIEYLNKNYPDWDTDSYTEEEIAALQDTYSHFLNGDYLMQGSDNNTFTDNTTLSTTNHLYSPDFIAWLRSYYRDEIAPKMNCIDSLTVEEAASFHEALNSFKEVLTQARIEIAYVLQDLSSYEDLAVMQDTIESYIASLNGNETDTTVDPGSLDGPNPIGGGHHQYHFVQYGETQEYLESLVKEGYMMVYHEDNPPEEGKLTISKPNPDPGTITVTVVANPTEYIYGPYEPLQLTVEELIAALGPEKYEALINTTITATTTDTTVNDTTDRTITLPGGLIVKLSDVLQVTDSLPDDTNTYFYRVSDYINPETGRLEDIPIPLYVFKNSEQVAFISTVDADTEAVKSVQVACAEDDGWRTVGVLNNPDGIDWKYQAGNLTGSGAASVVWHAQELGALGVWTDGTDNWTGIAGWFDENWTMLGCGDFDGDGKDSVLMSLNDGLFYSVDLDGTLMSLGGLNWSGWEFGAAGDFAGDGKDDIVLLHRESGSVVLLADGNADDYTSIGQLDASDWGIAGAGDFDGDGKADLLVRQTSTGLAGAYAGGDMNRWSMIDTTSEYYLA